MVGSWTKRSLASRALRLALVSCAVLAGGLVFSNAPALAAGGIPPLIGPITFGGQSSGEGILEAQINPEGHETNYEITLDCPGQERCQHTEGTLPADHEEHAVSLELTGLQSGITYRFGIYARSTAGAAAWPGEDEFTVQPIPSGSAPNGVLDTESYTPPSFPGPTKAATKPRPELSPNSAPKNSKNNSARKPPPPRNKKKPRPEKRHSSTAKTWRHPLRKVEPKRAPFPH